MWSHSLRFGCGAHSFGTIFPEIDEQAEHIFRTGLHLRDADIAGGLSNWQCGSASGISTRSALAGGDSRIGCFQIKGLF